MIGSEQGTIHNSKIYKALVLGRRVSPGKILSGMFRNNVEEGYVANSILNNSKTRSSFGGAGLKFLFSSYYFTSVINGPYQSRQIVEDLVRIWKEIHISLKKNWGSDLTGIGGIIGGKEIILYNLILKLKPKLVIETGVAQGMSSRFILEALNRNQTGRLISIDLPNYDPSGTINPDGVFDGVHVKEELGVGWLVPQDLRERWNLRLGDSRTVLTSLKEKPDIFLHDSDHSYGHMMFEFEYALENLTENGILISDDICWNNSFRDFLALHPGRIASIYLDKFTGVAKKLPLSQ